MIKNVNYERKWNRSVRFRTFGRQGGEDEMAGGGGGGGAAAAAVAAAVATSVIIALRES